MKKSVLLLLIAALCLFFVSCAETKDKKTTEDEKGSSVAVSKTENAETKEEVKENLFSKEEPLFFAQDRYDVEGDSGSSYYYNYLGEIISRPTPQNIGFYSENGLAPARDPKSGKIGFVNQSGEFIIDPIYDNTKLFKLPAPFSKHGIALVEKKKDENTFLSGYINEKGEEIVPCIYDTAFSFYNNGYAIVGMDASKEEKISLIDGYKYGMIDQKGNLVVEMKYASILNVYEDYFLGELMMFDELRENFPVDTYEINGKLAIVAYDGNIIADCPITNEDQTLFYQIKSDYSGIVRDVYAVDFSQEEFTERFKYLKTEVFNGKEFVPENIGYEISSKKVATTSTGIGYGIEKDGKIVIPFEYDQILQYRDSFIAIKKNGAYEESFDIFDENFNKTAENVNYFFDTERINTVGEKCVLPEGYFGVYKELEGSRKLYGVIDASGKEIVPVVFDGGYMLYTYESLGRFVCD